MDTSKKMKISVVIATYNGESYLHQQLTSIITQTHPIDEIIVVDDASDDNTHDLLLQFSKKHPQFTIKVIENKNNIGINATFEAALKKATGDFIFFSDQDDVWDKNKVLIMLKKWDGSLLSCSDAKIVDTSLNIISKSELAFTQSQLYTTDIPFLFSNCISGHNIMITKELLPKVFPFPKSMMFDQWLALVAKSYASLQITKDTLCLHRMHSSNAHNSFSTKPKKNRKNRSKSIAMKKEKIEIFHSGITQGAQTLLKQTPRTHLELLTKIIEHGKNLDNIIFNFSLFMQLLKTRNELFLNTSGNKRIRAIRNLCIGKKGYWLKF